MDVLLIPKLMPLFGEQLRNLRHSLRSMRIIRISMVDRAKRIHHPRILHARMRPPRFRLKLCPRNQRRFPPSPRLRRKIAGSLCPHSNRRLCSHWKRSNAPTTQSHPSHRAQPAAALTHPTLHKETHTNLSVGSEPQPTPVNPPKVPPRIPSPSRDSRTFKKVHSFPLPIFLSFPLGICFFLCRCGCFQLRARSCFTTSPPPHP